ncbi:MAG: hypothetical protein Ct9H300mP15_28240 [Gemmatimonadota bacterium]|nr:MAG: hypothetical protein Ct9H300mP15_28240 [Gemmatimonadota bacterium]
MNEPVTKKVYYSIGDVCDLTGLKPHVLGIGKLSLKY